MRAFGCLYSFIRKGFTLLVSLTFMAIIAGRMLNASTKTVLTEADRSVIDLVKLRERLREQFHGYIVTMDATYDYVVFDAIEGNNRDIFILNYNNGTLRQLTHYSGIDLFPRLSPDGRYVAFISYRDGNAEVYVLTLASGFLRNISQNPGPDALYIWSPDSHLLAFASKRNGSSSLYLADVERGMIHKLIPDLTFGTAVEWLPDGSLHLRTYGE